MKEKTKKDQTAVEVKPKGGGDDDDDDDDEDDKYTWTYLEHV